MIQFTFIFAFVLSIAATALGILLSIQLRKQSLNHPISNHILFQQILFFVFAFYASWGQVLTQIIFSADLINTEIIDRISNYIALFSIPFLLGAWYFLILISLQLAERKKQSLKAGIFTLIAVLFGIILIVALKGNYEMQGIFQKGFTIVNAIIYSITALYFGLSKKCKYRKLPLLFIVFLIAALGVIYSVGAWYHSYTMFTSILFIVFLFVGNVWIPILFKIGFELNSPNEEVANFSFDDFCLKFEISKREKEIIQLICEGLRNKDIAEKLFITLQTVKDHTSRIYLKTEVKNRTQLSNLVRDNS